MSTTKLSGSIVYLSGAISADPNYKAKFRQFEQQALMSDARLVLNPAIFPPGWDYDAYMEHCLIMVRRCDTMFMLPDWKESPGACAEHAYAVSLKKNIVYAEEIESTIWFNFVEHLKRKESGKWVPIELLEKLAKAATKHDQ